MKSLNRFRRQNVRSNRHDLQIVCSFCYFVQRKHKTYTIRSTKSRFQLVCTMSMKPYKWFVRPRYSACRAMHQRDFVCCVARQDQVTFTVLFCSHAFFFYNCSLSILLCVYCSSLYIMEWPNDTAETFNSKTGKENV
jgi:hypothetical protein